MKKITCDICMKVVGGSYSRPGHRYDDMSDAFRYSEKSTYDMCFECEDKLRTALNKEIEKIKGEIA